MKLMGLDIGTKRIGVATAELALGVSLPKVVIAAGHRAAAIAEIARIAAEDGTERIVAGLPLSTEGADTEMTTYVRQFVSELEQTCSTEICLWDERFTSQQSRKAYQSGPKSASKVRKAGLVDMMAAVYILDSYITAQEVG